MSGYWIPFVLASILAACLLHDPKVHHGWGWLSLVGQVVLAVGIGFSVCAFFMIALIVAAISDGAAP